MSIIDMPIASEHPTILIIDDDVELSLMITELLQREGMAALCAATAATGMALLATGRPDVLLLDLMLPDANGIDVCRRLRQTGSDLPVLMLTARGDPIDRVLGLELGADDYLGKPFEPRELVARLRALIRRGRASGKSTQLRFEGMTIDLMTRRVGCQEEGQHGESPRILQLTSNEFKLLATLAGQVGTVIAREALSSAVQPGSYMPLERAVDVQIARLRKKLRLTPDGREWIETVRGEGYLFTGKPL
jgi:DNA-binding response OmpR family regulator